MRLLEEAKIENVLIPRNTFLIGIISIKENIIEVIVSNIRSQGAYIKTYLCAYDSEGNKGIYVEKPQEKPLENDLSEDLLGDATMAIPTPGVGKVSHKILQRKNKKEIKITLPDGFKIFLKKEEKKHDW